MTESRIETAGRLRGGQHGVARFSDRPRFGLESLTARERRICDGVAAGLSNDAIGKDLFIAEQTVKFHLTNIYRKLDLKHGPRGTVRRVALAIFWLDHTAQRARLWDCCGYVIYTPHCPWCGAERKLVELSA